jgi:DNA-binding NtrC family response regulator
VLYVLSASTAEKQLQAQLADDGRFAQAAGGTLVLDRLNEFTPTAQSRLVQLVQRYGDTVRVIGISHKPVDDSGDVEGTNLQEGLQVRLAAGRLKLPSLRERDGDIALLTSYFWASDGGTGPLPEALAEKVEAAHWPGNVAQLRNTILAAIALGDAFDIGALRFDERARSSATEMAPNDIFTRLLTLDLSMQEARECLVHEFEQQYLEVALKKHGGNVTRAAAASGLTRRYFHMLRAKKK